MRDTQKVIDGIHIRANMSQKDLQEIKENPIMGTHRNSLIRLKIKQEDIIKQIDQLLKNKTNPGLP